MKWVVRIVAILVLLLAAAAAAAFLLLPKSVQVERTFAVERPAQSVVAWLATTPAGDAFADGVTETVRSTAPGKIEMDLAVGGRSGGQAVYLLTPTPTGGMEVKLTATRDFGGDIMARLAKARGQDTFEQAVDAGVATLAEELNALPSQFDFKGLQYTIEDAAARPFIYIEASTKQVADNIKRAMRISLAGISTFITEYKLEVAGPPVAVELSWQDDRYAFQTGLPYKGERPDEEIGVKFGDTPAGRVIKVVYEGPEENIIPVYDQVETLIAASRLQRSGPSFEIFLDDPTQEGGSVKREIYHLIEGDDAALSRIPALN